MEQKPAQVESSGLVLMDKKLSNSRKLIQMVKERPSLWNPRDVNYHYRSYNKKMWLEIANELQGDAMEIKYKWRSLREGFRIADHDKIGQLGKPRWHFYDELIFLKAVVTRKQKSPPCPVAQPSNVNLNNEVIMKEDIKIEEESLGDSTEITFHDYSQISENDAIDETNFCDPIEYKNTNSVPEKHFEQEDANYHFLMSLLPTMRNLDQLSNMRFRLKVQEFLIHELEKSNH